MIMRIHLKDDDEYDTLVDWLYEHAGNKGWRMELVVVNAPKNSNPKIDVIVTFDRDMDPYLIPMFTLRWS